jgi:hypothetical protein
MDVTGEYVIFEYAAGEVALDEEVEMRGVS